MKNHKPSSSSKPPNPRSHKPNPNPSSSSSSSSKFKSTRRSRWEQPPNSTANNQNSTSTANPKQPQPPPQPKPNNNNTNTNNNNTPNRNPNPNPNPTHPPPAATSGGPHPRDPSPPPPPPPYGFHNLDRRTIVLADGTARSYFSLPPDYPLMGPTGIPDPFRNPHDGAYLPPASTSSDGGGKRKYPDDFDERQHVQPQPQPQYGDRQRMPPPKQARLGGGSEEVRLDNVDRNELRSAFLKYAKSIHEQKQSYMEDGRNGALHCLVCGRASKEFADLHGLVLHAYYSHQEDSRVDHLGLHKALCVLMGWNYARIPDNSKSYQLLDSESAQANREDLILWPPTVIIQNTCTGRKKDGRVEGMGNREMDAKLKELGFPDGKARSLYGKEGHLGLTLVKFASSQAGLKEAERLAGFFQREGYGRRGWARVQSTQSGHDDKNPMLVRKDGRTGEQKRIFYGYLAIASDLDDIDSDTRRRSLVKSLREFDLSD